jgi:uncharacterized protein (DUF2344 family)
MFKIEDILSENFSSYPEDVQQYMIKYTEKFREALKEELTKDLAERMLKDIDKSNETFMNILTEILYNGCKGFDKMSTRTLLNIYLEKKSQEDFIKLLEGIT